MTKPPPHGAASHHHHHNDHHDHKAEQQQAALAWRASQIAAWQQSQDADNAASAMVDLVLRSVEGTIHEAREAKNTFEYTSMKIVTGLVYMMSMVTIDLTTKFKDNPATYEAGPMPEHGLPDIWSKQFIKARQKRRSIMSRRRRTADDDDADELRRRSPSRYSQGTRGDYHTDFPHIDDEITMSIRDLAFQTFAIDVPLPKEEIERRHDIEVMLEEREYEFKRKQMAEAKRSRSVAPLLIAPLDGDTKRADEILPPSSEEPEGASQVILIEDAEMIVGEDSHLVSRRSKIDVLKHLPNPTFEPTITVPTGVASGRKDSARCSLSRGSNSRSNANNSRNTSRKTARSTKTPSRRRSLLSSLLVNDDTVFVKPADMLGGPRFDENQSPAKGVVIKQGHTIRAGDQWHPPSKESSIPRSISEPVLGTPTDNRQSKLAIPEDSDMPDDGLPPQILSLDPIGNHRHATSKSMNVRIRTPACRKRRSRKLVEDVVLVEPQPDAEDNNTPERVRRRPSTTNMLEPQKIIKSPVKLPHVSDGKGRRGGPFSGVTVENLALSLPLLKPIE
ncbi:unnamed protein product [Aphanomyces euteiches]|uniref:Uncharacterized protein n=1 Tax=Aphanomyces euteiches TaxID=100861 RepID=A0A6G0X1Z9_9STRA|nr:hypothetical protein Ae201684_009465 [Aphanomyces euteiches]KAH9069931.1 hypothetical protein Ae201684P_002305 [Aphanomyces euteiches]KAH9136224.1 hypothetical protein AeRB84_018555 [Aphanomyces euteiches]